MAPISQRAYKAYLLQRLEGVMALLKHRRLRRILTAYRPLLVSSQSTNEPWTQPLLEHYLSLGEYVVATLPKPKP